MYPKQHIIFGIVFSLLLFIIYPQINLIGLSLLFFSSVLIDVDHYTYYVYKKKDWSLRRAYKWFMSNEKKFLSLPRKLRNNYYGGFFFLHGVEMLFILILLTMFVSKYFFFIFIGIFFHLLLDIVDEPRYKDRIDKVSVIHDFLKFKKLKFVDQ